MAEIVIMRKILTRRRKSQRKNGKLVERKLTTERKREIDSHEDAIFKARKWRTKVKSKWSLESS